MMILYQQIEEVIQLRKQRWESEVQHHQLLQQIPQKAAQAKLSQWQRWIGTMLIYLGRLSMRWGRRMIKATHHKRVQLPTWPQPKSYQE